MAVYLRRVIQFLSSCVSSNDEDQAEEVNEEAEMENLDEGWEADVEQEEMRPLSESKNMILFILRSQHGRNPLSFHQLCEAIQEEFPQKDIRRYKGSIGHALVELRDDGIITSERINGVLKYSFTYQRRDTGNNHHQRRRRGMEEDTEQERREGQRHQRRRRGMDEDTEQERREGQRHQRRPSFWRQLGATILFSFVSGLIFYGTGIVINRYYG